MSEIIGNTTATPNPCPDWAQTDETKADYIKNKPIPSETHTNVAYVNDVPKDAKSYAKISKVGGLTRKCNNLIPFPYYSTDNDTFTSNSDGSVTITASPANWDYNYTVANSLYLSQGTYCFTVEGGKNLRGYVDADGMLYYSNENNVFTLDSSTTVSIYLQGDWIDDFYIETVYPMLNRGDTPSSYEPYFEGFRTAKVTEIESIGANLIPYPFDLTTLNGYGVSVSVDSSQRVVISGSPTSNREAKMIEFSLPVGTYSFSAEQTSGATRAVLRKNGEMIRSQAKADSTYIFTVSSKYDVYAVSITILTGNTYSNDIVAPMINIGTTALSYKPYTKHTLPIPAELQNIDRYGYSVRDNLFNYIDFEKQLFVERVGCVDMGTLNWVGFASTVLHTDRVYKPDAGSLVVIPPQFNKIYVDPYGAIVATFDEGVFASKDEAKAAITGVMLYYELAEPRYTDISHLITPDNYIEVEGGGTITMVNEYGYDVPNSIIYTFDDYYNDIWRDISRFANMIDRLSKLINNASN